MSTIAFKVNTTELERAVDGLARLALAFESILAAFVRGGEAIREAFRQVDRFTYRNSRECSTCGMAFRTHYGRRMHARMVHARAS